ncbi:cupin domain-containing protein [Oscillibacter sp.]|uniref:cupin domain-containing protein n=1 Tax=Oscillibacter sp. TaxID=1945593 RepID=UPI00260F53F7|nr:cupin domain-containing protein [Oscillibacter sp.]MDD3347856.1 cupin domain-containing protein [Oscillibacter sp.]
MLKENIFELKGTEFPAGRRTRVMLGENGCINGELFCQGYVVIYPGGSVPKHEHPTVESYTILRGTGEMTVGSETQTVKEGDFIYLPAGEPHELKNTGTKDLHMMFVYAPKTVVDHWEQELRGELK